MNFVWFWRKARDESRNRFSPSLFPEREDPGRNDANVKTIPKVVGGYTPKCTDLGENALWAGTG